MKLFDSQSIYTLITGPHYVKLYTYYVKHYVLRRPSVNLRHKLFDRMNPGSYQIVRKISVSTTRLIIYRTKSQQHSRRA